MSQVTGRKKAEERSGTTLRHGFRRALTNVCFLVQPAQIVSVVDVQHFFGVIWIGSPMFRQGMGELLRIVRVRTRLRVYRAVEN